MKRVGRGLSLLFAIGCLLGAMAEAAGCVRALPPHPVSGGVRNPAPSSVTSRSSTELRDDDSGFFFGTKCATIRIRDWRPQPTTPLTPPAASVERAADELP